MIYSIGRQERTFQVRHFKACPVAVLDGATAFGGGNLLFHGTDYGFSNGPPILRAAHRIPAFP
jgi:hypothetical protein